MTSGPDPALSRRVTINFAGDSRFTGRWSYCEVPAYPGHGTWSGARLPARR